MSAGSAWGELRDFTRYAAQDTFHAEFRIEGDIPRSGARFVVTHRFLLFSVRRVGRILRWRELDRLRRTDGRPARPPCGLQLQRLVSARLCATGSRTRSAIISVPRARLRTLEIVVRGRWTARPVPRWAASLWLRWVFGQVVMSVRNSLLLAATRRHHVRNAREAISHPFH